MPETQLFDRTKRVLILVESPEKAKTISKIFRDAGYNRVIIQATIGHFTKIADGGGAFNSGIYPEKDFKMDLVVDPDKKAVVSKLKEQVAAADSVYICTDPDREGEAIAQTCVDFLKIPKSKYKRATYQAINQKAIFEAIRNASDIDKYLVKSANVRKILDKLFGYGVSQVLRDNKKGKSGGRCQTPTLGMVYDRDIEIENFVPEKYFDLYLHFFKNNTEFKAKYYGTDANPIKRLDTQEQIDEIFEECKGHSFVVEAVDHKDRLENPKPPFSTITCQKECGLKLGLPGGQVDSCLQKLFDSGKISYHRTDSEEFEEEFTQELKQFVKENFDPKYVSGTVVKGKKDENAQEGHEALHVLDLNLTPERYAQEAPSELLSKVYRIIYNRTVAAALKPAIIAQTTYNIYNNKKHKFILNSNELKFDGYRCIYSNADATDEKDSIVKETFRKGEELKECSFESIPQETKPPAHYKVIGFEEEIKKAGIGRPSTYSRISQTVKDESRGYCVVEDKYLKTTPLGRQNIEFVREYFGEIVDINYTKKMEDSLDAIAHHELDDKVFLNEFYNKLNACINKVSPQEKICPECGAPMKKKVGKYGAFFGCSNYPKCKHIEK